MVKFNEEQREAVRVALIISKRLTAKLEAQVALDGDHFGSQADVWQMFNVYEIEAEQLRAKLMDVGNGGIDVDMETGAIVPKDGEV